MSEPRILVIGEKFIDRYYIGTATRLSPEAPIPVVAVSEVIQTAGGAGNVSENLRALGAEVTEIYQQTPYPTKNRLIGNGQQLARWDEHDYTAPFGPYKIRLWAPFFQDKDAIVISDYGKGAFTFENASTVIQLAGKTPVFIDTKNICKWPRSGPFFFPNMKEWQTEKEEYLEAEHVIRTESEHGMSYLHYGVVEYMLRAHPGPVVSVCGAGDTAIAAFAYAYSKYGSWAPAMEFATLACAVAVSKPYTATVSHEEINQIRG